MGGPVRGPGAATVGSSRLPPAAHGDGDRFLGRETWNESGTQKTLITYYIGDYQAVLDPSLGGITSEVTQHSDVLRFVATYSGAYGVEYMFRDHLGSVMVSSNGAGTQMGPLLSFDPFGSRRNKDWQSDTLTASDLSAILDNVARAMTIHSPMVLPPLAPRVQALA